MVIGVQTDHAQDVPRLLAENDGVWRPVRGSEVVWMQKVRVEQNRAHRHPHRLTAQWLGKQAFRVSQTIFFLFVCVGLVADWEHVIVCFGGGFVQARSSLHEYPAAPSENRWTLLRGWRDLRGGAISERFSPPCMWKNASYRFLSAACVRTGLRRKGATLGWWLQTTGITLNHIVVQFPP